jgi:rhodanese-related sulfurtransferase
MHRASPTTITNLNVDPTSQINVDRWWESYIPIEIAAETTSPFIDVNETIEIKDRLTFIDIRSKDDFRESHIENSITIPAVVLESGDLLPTLEEPLSFITHLKTALPPFSIVVIVGDKTLCANAFAKILSRHGCKYVCILRGGFDAVLADA